MSSKKSLSDWLSYIEALHTTEIDLGLTRIAEVAKRLKLSPKASNANVITVAGTNGKGSTCQLIHSILNQTSITSGVFSSPHFLEYNERIVVNGQQVSDQQLVNVFEEIESARAEISLSYFEFGALAACCIFQKLKLDIWILEVGLGGRLDAVNIIDNDVAIVTSIAVDHVDWLGDDINVIGFEKAAIARSGKVLIDASIDSPDSVAETALNQGATHLKIARDYEYQVNDNVWTWQSSKNTFKDLPVPSLPIMNAASAIQALMSLNIELSANQIEKGLLNAQLTGRLQREVYQGNKLILDVAHNPHAARYIARELSLEPKNTHIIFAALKDKDIKATLMALKPLAASWGVIELKNDRAISALEIANMIDQPVDVSDTMLDALNLIPTNAEQTLICGSFFTIAETLKVLKSKKVEG
jgi:dihydrofolate synthase / folylpolyglutamate synthase